MCDLEIKETRIKMCGERSAALRQDKAAALSNVNRKGFFHQRRRMSNERISGSYQL